MFTINFAPVNDKCVIADDFINAVDLKIHKDG